MDWMERTVLDTKEFNKMDWMVKSVVDIKEFNKNGLNGKRIFLILRNLIKMDWMEREYSWY